MIDVNDLAPASGTLFIPVHEEAYILWQHSNLGLSIIDWVEEMILAKAVEAKVWKKDQPLWVRRNWHFPYYVPRT